MTSVAFVINPKARAAAGLRSRIEAIQRRRAPTARWVEFDRMGDLARPPDRLIAVGGDGTVRGVTEFVVANDWASAIGIVAGGTGNNLARGLGLPLDPELATETALSPDGPVRDIDLVRVRADGEVFHILQSAALGFPATIAARYDWLRHVRGLGFLLRPLGDQVYRLLAGFGLLDHGLRGFLEGATLRLMLTHEGVPHSLAGLALFIANDGSIGGDFHPAPGAKPDDGVMDLCWVGNAPLDRTWTIFQDFTRGDQGRNPEVQFFRSSAPIEIACDRPTALLLDGDVHGPFRHLELELLPLRARIIGAVSRASTLP